MEENKDESLILGGRALEECERICSPQFCLQEALLKSHRWLHSQKGFFYCIFQRPINCLYLHLCVGNYDCCCCCCCCCCCLDHGRSHLDISSKRIAHSLQVECRQISPSEELNSVCNGVWIFTCLRFFFFSSCPFFKVGPFRKKTQKKEEIILSSPTLTANTQPWEISDQIMSW